jgi:predicted Zn-dependent protease
LPDEREFSRRSKGKLYAVVGGVGLVAGLVLAVAVVLTLAAWRPRKPRRVVVPENPEQRRQEMREAFAPKKAPPAQKEAAAGIEALFADLGAAFRAADGKHIIEHFDVERMVEELDAQQALPPQVRRDRKEFARVLRLGLERHLEKEAADMAWKTADLRNIRKMPDDEAVVIARHHTPDGAVSKMRWWVTRRSGDWKVYDFEELSCGLRVTGEMAVALRAGRENVRESVRAFVKVREALQAVDKGDADKADQKLKEIAGVRMLPKMDSVRLLATALLHLQREQFKEAVATVDRARALNPDMPVLDLVRGNALNGLGQWAEALKHLEAYRDLLGEDEDVCERIGDSLRGLGRAEEAAASYRKALDHNPKQADSLLGLLRSLRPQDRRDDVPARFARLDQPRETIVNIAEALREDQDAAGLEQVVTAMRKIEARFAPADYYECLLRAWAGNEREAVRLFKSAVAAADPTKREDYRTGFLQAMARSGKGLAAYTAVPPPHRPAFAFLADQLKQEDEDEELALLVAAHAKKDPDDPLLPFYRGEVHAWEEDYPLAEKAFAAGMARPPDRATLAKFRPARVLARYHTGRALSAYKEIGPRQETFAQLAGLALRDDNHALLEQLLDAHARAEPGDPVAARYRYRLKVRQGRPGEAVPLFQAALARVKDEKQRGQMVVEFLDDMREAGKMLEGYRAVPDARQAFEALADGLVDPDHLPDLRRLLEAHRQRQPDDPRLQFFMGELHLEEKAWDKAVKAFSRWWQKTPEDARKSLHWKYVLALHRAGKWKQAYEHVGPRNETFAQLAYLLYADKKGQPLQELVAAHRPHAGADPDLLFHEARAKLLLKEQAQAEALLQKAFRRQKDEHNRWECLSLLVHARLEQGKPLEGYRAAPDRVLAFQILAGELLCEKKAADLQRLVEEHGTTHPQDPYYRYYAGELSLLRGNAALAEAHFTAGRGQAPRQQEWMFRQGLLRARVHAGKVAETYREFGPGEDAFLELAGVCRREQSTKGLAALLAEHRKARPDDPNLPAWELEAKWFEKDYAGALKLIISHRTGVLARPRWRSLRDEYLVRGLVRLKKPAEAVREAEALAVGKRGDRLLLVLAHAANGDVNRAVAAVGKGRGVRFLRGRCYADDDLGPILRGEPFKAFRAKFPEPKGEDGSD